jgi:hypothetical protein
MTRAPVDSAPKPPASVVTGGEAPAAPAPMTAAQRSDLLHQIADLRTEDRFQAALGLAAKLDGEDRDRLQKQITADHDQRRKDLETVVANNTDMDLIKKLVVPAQTTWGMPGDLDWANDLVAKSATRAAAPADTGPVGQEAPKTPPGPVSALTGQPLRVQPVGTQPAAADPADPAATAGPASAPSTAALPPITDPAAAANATIDQALLAFAPTAAQQALGSLDQGAPDTRALKHKIEWWNRRAGLIARAAQSGKAKLRLPNPTTNETWDVVGADADHLEVTSPAGSRSTLPWTQFQPKDVAKIFQAAADLPEATGEDSAIAVVMCLLANDPTQASLQIKNHKAVIDADLGADLDALISLHKRRDLTDVLTRANDALKNGNAKGVADALAELKKADKTTQAALAPQIQRLEEASQKLAASKPAATAPSGPAVQGKDKLTFDALEDLQQVETEGTRWQVNGGAITNLVDGARIGRRDLGNAKSISLRFQTSQNKGTMTVDFRGAKVVLDLGASTYTVSGKGAGRPKGFAIIPKLPYTMLLERKDDARTTLQFNNGAESAEIQVGDLSDTFTLAVEGGGTISLDDLEIFREGRAATMAEKQKALKVTGWEPINGAYLEAPAIVLPPSPGAPCGIATPLRDNVSGYNFEVKGSGVLQFKLARISDKDQQKWASLEIDLPKNAQEWMTVAVRWTDKGAAVYDAKGNELKSIPLTDKYTHLMIVALNQATLASAPRIEYKSP